MHKLNFLNVYILESVILNKIDIKFLESFIIKI